MHVSFIVRFLTTTATIVVSKSWNTEESENAPALLRTILLLKIIYQSSIILYSIFVYEENQFFLYLIFDLIIATCQRTEH